MAELSTEPSAQLASTVLTRGRSKSATLSWAGCRTPTGPAANPCNRLSATWRAKSRVRGPSGRSQRSTSAQPQRSVPAVNTPAPDDVV